MSYIQSIQKAIDYIEAHLKEDLSLEEVASQASYSVYHFHRIFKSIVGCSVKDYIKRRRLTYAAFELNETDKRMIDIAYDYGYESQEAFTRAFKQLFSVLPGKYRKTSPYLDFIDPYQLIDIFDSDTDHHKLQPKKVCRGPFHVVGIELSNLHIPGSPNRNDTTEMDIPTLWEYFHSRVNEVEGRINPFISYGIGRPLKDGSHFTYTACVEVESSNVSIPDGFVNFDVSGGTYAAFQHKGSAENISKLGNYIYGSWIPSSNYHVNFGVEIEVYDERNEQKDDHISTEIWVPVKEKSSPEGSQKQSK
ncbi:AraC family transcriptional regulator [Evansella halocellulosilytica]|uniref:AraC family transcriptional regulator n=1 Tax=Evansella halocellulosilytica TaxID=2011013 RepID=UPI000BB80D9E|nr:AraC family transcriptional regulator [Evansella halocellulosilytica]